MFPLILISSFCISAISAEIPIQAFGTRIVNGEDAKLGQFPWQVAIFGKSQIYPSYLCGGALISDQWVLTAGHCVVGAISANIYSGMVQISSRNKTISQASEFVLHPQYDSNTLSNDIGLIKLSEPVKIDANTKSIRLSNETLKDGTSVTFSGYGSLSDHDSTPYSDFLKYISVSTISNKACTGYYGSAVITDGKVCTLDPEKSPCEGDSGAPVVANLETDPVHVGIFSFVNGYGCEYNYPAGSIRTAYYRDWIRSITNI